MFILEKDFWY